MQDGDVIGMTHWTAHQPGLQVSFRANKGRIGMFLLLGEADKAAPETFDAVGSIRALGWVPGDETSPTPPQPIYDESKERELFEAYCAKVGLPTDTLPSGEYLIPATRFMSQGWHARIKAGKDAL